MYKKNLFMTLNTCSLSVLDFLRNFTSQNIYIFVQNQNVHYFYRREFLSFIVFLNNHHFL